MSRFDESILIILGLIDNGLDFDFFSKSGFFLFEHSCSCFFLLWLGL